VGRPERGGRLGRRGHGDGASINIWSDFGYDSLFQTAKERGLLQGDDERLFETLGIENFEEVLQSLSESIRIGAALGRDRSLEIERQASIREALAKAVHSVHVNGGTVPITTFEAIRDELRNYRHAFTTSYDLLIYWSMAKGGASPFQGFYDFFWANDRCAFDEGTIRIHPDSSNTRIYFLHGALHIVALPDGTTCKRRASAFDTLLDQFGEPLNGDRTARPLVVTEARAADKRRSIEGNDYLSYCWRTLRGCSCPIVVFGLSLRDQDAHLIEADEIYFFDSKTHPFGDKELRIKEASWWKRMQTLKIGKQAA
jgi:hypothetical protein